MSLNKRIYFTERYSFQARLEAFNVFNHPVWGDPIMAMTSPLYGTINSTRIPMRELQIGVKFSF